jgi:hypothetical protein
MPIDKTNPPSSPAVQFKDLRLAESFVPPAELATLRRHLKALGENAVFRQQAAFGESIAKIARENSAFQRLVEEEEERRRHLEQITRPFADMLAAHARDMSATADVFRDLEERMSGMRALFAALDNVPHLRVGFPEFAFRGFTELQQAAGDFLVGARPGDDADTIVADREISLAGAVAVAATAVEAPAVEMRSIQIVGSIDTVLVGRLPQLRPGLLEHWQGARDALATANPNRVSLVSYSLRELAKGTVNALVAPEEADFQLWVKQQPNGKASLDWKARFLLRKTQLPAAFTEADAKWVVQAFDHLNREGVHREGAPAQSDAELRSILRRIEGWLASLIEVSNRGG